MEGSRQEMLVKDRDSLAQVNKLEREKSNVQEEERMKREETESELKNKLRHCESEVHTPKAWDILFACLLSSSTYIGFS